MTQKGFTTLIMVSFLPLIGALIFLVLFSQNLIQSYTYFQNQCRNSILRTQQVLAYHLNEVLKLNPRATYLRNEEKILRAAIIAAGENPPLVAALQAQLSYNQKLQLQLRVKMEGLVYTAQAKAFMVQSQIHTKSKHVFSKNMIFKTERPYLNLIKNPITAIAPNFEPHPDFEEKQNLKISWSYDFLNFFPTSLKKFKITSYCQSTLARKDSVWEPHLSVAKFY